jgi:hypothetical protein
MWRMGVLAGLLVLWSAFTVGAFEPQSVVGEWVGEWNNGRDTSDAVYMTVKAVSGGRVDGTLHRRAIPGSPYDNRDLPFVGTLVGHMLSVRGAPTVPGSPPMSFSYNISRDGTRMAGFFQATDRSAVSLAKRQ